MQVLFTFLPSVAAWLCERIAESGCYVSSTEEKSNLNKTSDGMKAELATLLTSCCTVSSESNVTWTPRSRTMSTSEDVTGKS